jgi:hypothetical protein
VIVLGWTYVEMYTDRRGQAQTERGRLVALDRDGFVVRLLMPKASLDVLVKVEL